jgi:hypothetical protein
MYDDDAGELTPRDSKVFRFSVPATYQTDHGPKAVTIPLVICPDGMYAWHPFANQWMYVTLGPEIGNPYDAYHMDRAKLDAAIMRAFNPGMGAGNG